jgi:Spy/CpxP family protein refolding chaperone
MMNCPDLRKTPTLLLALVVAMMAPGLALAQGLPAGAPQPQETQTPQTAVPQDPITQLNLTPEQRQRIRAIREQNKDERAAINRRLRETNIALDQALDADTPNEALIEQRVREAGEAQTATIRLRVLTEVRIRRVLTVEQINTLRQLRAQARREQRQENRDQNRRPAANGRPLPNQGNGMTPDPNLRRNGLPRRPLQ